MKSTKIRPIHHLLLFLSTGNHDVPALRLESVMPSPRKETRGGRAFAGPLLGVLLLVACYAVLSDWHDLPTMIDAALASMHWPV